MTDYLDRKVGEYLDQQVEHAEIPVTVWVARTFRGSTSVFVDMLSRDLLRELECRRVAGDVVQIMLPGGGRAYVRAGELEQALRDTAAIDGED
jgi:hypothetical protein